MRSLVAATFTALLLAGCDPGPAKESAPRENSDAGYRNLSADAHYVGMQTCAGCHQDIYNSFLRTGMGRSFGVAERSRSAADFSNARLTDTHTGFSYHASWHN